MKKKSRVVLVLLLLSLSFYCSDNDIQQVKANHKKYIEWWIYNHGDYANSRGKDDPRVGWAFSVFKRVKNVADKTGSRPPRLFIIDSNIEVYSLVLPDGGIIICPKTLDICYHSVKKVEGDSRLAFILGHELAHLSHDDYIHVEAFQAVATDSVSLMDKKSNYEIPSSHQRLKELMADKTGALFAAMAGYPIGKLFKTSNSFLEIWAKRSGVDYKCDKTPSHPSFEKRLHFIRPQLMNVVNNLELFRAGLLLFAVDNWEDSAAAFKEFAKLYPSREIWNNIGLCYLRLALHQLYMRFSDDFYRFRLSVALDYSTTAESLEPRGGAGDYLEDREIAVNLEEARYYLGKAEAQDCRDRACRLNLAAVFILTGEYARAQDVCDKILKYKPNDADALNNKAIAFYYYGNVESLNTSQKALNVLKKALKSAPSNYRVQYNLARIKQLRNRTSAALKAWKKYLAGDQVPHDNFYAYIYNELYGSLPPGIPLSRTLAKVPEVPLGLRLGVDFSGIIGWEDAETQSFKLGLDSEYGKDSWHIDLRVLLKQGVRALVQDQVLEIIEQEVPQGVEQPLEDYLIKLGPPQKIIQHGHGNYYVYKDMGFSLNEIDGRVRSRVWFEKGF